MGATFDWDARGRHLPSPSYYRWNQWLFLRFLEAGLAYRQMSPVDWCPNDGTLAREQVEGADRHCWRCGALVEKRDLEQWFLRTTDVRRRAARLHGHRLARADPDPADELDRPLGRRRGRLHDRPVGAPRRAATSCASSRRGPDTLFGATFMVLAPEHPLVADADARRTGAPRSTRTSSRRAGETEIDRLSTDREKTGVAIGADAINPVNGERIPIFIADYVLAGYGTGAIMAVPAHDERDFAFAQRFGLPIRRVVAAPGTDADAPMATPTSPTPPASAWSTAASSTGCRPTRAARRIVASWPSAGRPSPRSPTACATG